MSHARTATRPIDAFTRAFFEAALWVESANLGGGDDRSFSDHGFTIDDIDPYCREALARECESFEEEFGDAIDAAMQKEVEDVYRALKESGLPLDHHESDLYVIDSPQARRILQVYGLSLGPGRITRFVSQIDRRHWLDIPFAYTPFWEGKTKRTAVIRARERAGHDLWLTRNGHGVGFWDGDWPEPLAEILTDSAHRLGPVDLYVHRKRIYASGYEKPRRERKIEVPGAKPPTAARRPSRATNQARKRA